MNNLLQQLPTLIGVVIGALASYLATNASEGRRWRREQHVRWDERRISAYDEYAETLKKKAYGFLRLAAENGLNVQARPFRDEADRDQSLSEIESERIARWERVLLLGDEAVITAAQKYGETIFRLGDIAASTSVDRQHWLHAVQQMSKTVAIFIMQFAVI